MPTIQDIHHISAIVGHPQETYDFYSRVLGLKMIKQTVNFDDPSVYHLYFSFPACPDQAAITFFNWPDAKAGVVGSGQVGRIAFRVPQSSLDYWQERLSRFNIQSQKNTLFNRPSLEFSDYHGLDLALVEAETPANNLAIQGFHGTILLSKYPNQSADQLEEFLGLKKLENQPGYLHYQTQSEHKHHILIPTHPLDIRRLGPATVHHIAWTVEDEKALDQWQQFLEDKGQKHSGKRDRKYFYSLYYREAGKIIFELASKGPGFSVDEDPARLGQHLQLPQQLEHLRQDIEAHLPVIELKEADHDLSLYL